MLGRVSLLHWKPDHKHEVGGVTSGRQGTSSSGSLVKWTFVRMAKVNVISLLGDQPHSWHLGVKDLRMRFSKELLSFISVPSASLEVHTIDVGSIIWVDVGIISLWIRDNLEVKLNLIDGNDVLSSIVLFASSDERLLEE
jgi:hypothetical protein